MKPLNLTQQAVSQLLKREIIALFINHTRLTPLELKRALRCGPQRFDTAEVAAAINQMILDGSLFYTNHFSISHLELTTRTVNALSKGVSITSLSNADQRGDAHITISDGAAFGMGDHPTTRLAMEGLSWVISKLKGQGAFSDAAVLDVGTGSGILAIAAIRMGASRALGIDIEAQARHEAMANTIRNGMEDRITISDTKVEELGAAKYKVVLANLRPPTLIGLLPELHRVTTPDGCWVFSGFRPDEVTFIEQAIGEVFYKGIWRAEAGRWAAMVVEAVK